jgi:hypothetical protein
VATNEEAAASEEQVPRFGLRRGARFAETLREDTGSGDADDEWLADLRPGDADEAVVDSVEVGDEGRADQTPEPGAGPPEEAAEEHDPAGLPGVLPAVGHAMAMLEERLSTLEEALAKAAAACTVSRAVLAQAQAALGLHADDSAASEPGA